MIATRPTFQYEKSLWANGHRFVVGVDEVGRGAFAGPLVVGAVAYKDSRACSDSFLSEIDDSKRLSPKKRHELSYVIKQSAFVYTLASVSVPVINKVGIGKATFIAFRQVITAIIKSVHTQKLFVLVDGFYIPYLRGIGIKNQKAIVKGDQLSVSIASASVIAKVYRDTIMEKLHGTYSQYDFLSNKGYGTKFHRDVLKIHGLSPIHRTSFDLSKFLT